MYGALTKSANAVTGWVSTFANGLCSAASSHSRGPGRLSRARRGQGRSASVIGAPSTSSSGAIMLSTMCCVMCRLNAARP